MFDYCFFILRFLSLFPGDKQRTRHGRGDQGAEKDAAAEEVQHKRETRLRRDPAATLADEQKLGGTAHF